MTGKTYKYNKVGRLIEVETKETVDISPQKMIDLASVELKRRLRQVEAEMIAKLDSIAERIRKTEKV